MSLLESGTLCYIKAISDNNRFLWLGEPEQANWGRACKNQGVGGGGEDGQRSTQSDCVKKKKKVSIKSKKKITLTHMYAYTHTNMYAHTHL